MRWPSKRASFSRLRFLLLCLFTLLESQCFLFSLRFRPASIFSWAHEKCGSPSVPFGWFCAFVVPFMVPWDNVHVDSELFNKECLLFAYISFGWGLECLLWWVLWDFWGALTSEPVPITNAGEKNKMRSGNLLWRPPADAQNDAYRQILHWSLCPASHQGQLRWKVHKCHWTWRSGVVWGPSGHGWSETV